MKAVVTRTLLVSAIFAGTALIPIGTAVAAPGDDHRREPAVAAKGRIAPETASYTPVTSTDGEAGIMAVSPSGCVQQANNPHASHHQPGRMNGEIRATCNNAVPRMRHTAQMWETRWWGWDRIGIVGVFDQNWVSRGSAFGNDVCKKNWVRVTGDGFIDDVDGRRYYSSTESAHIYNPCNL